MNVRSPSLIILVLALAGLEAPLAKATSPSPAPTEAGKASVLWDSWYTVTAAGGIPFGYYNDRFERKDSRIAFKNQFWKREEGYINEEQVVAIAKDNELLSPEFWNFHSAYRSSTIDIDGSLQGNQMTVKVRENAKDQKPIARSISKKAFLSVMFPVWLSKRLSSMKPGVSNSFLCIFEDSLLRRFDPLSGAARLEKPDEFSQKSASAKVSVEIDGKKSIWYVLPSGEPVRIEMTSHKLIVNRVTEAQARRFLMDSQ